MKEKNISKNHMTKNKNPKSKKKLCVLVAILSDFWAILYLFFSPDFTTHFTTDPKWTGEKMLKAAYPLGEDSNWSRVRKGGTKVGAEEEE